MPPSGPEGLPAVQVHCLVSGAVTAGSTGDLWRRDHIRVLEGSPLSPFRSLNKRDARLPLHVNNCYRGHRPCVCKVACQSKGRGLLHRGRCPWGAEPPTPVLGQAPESHRPTEPRPAALRLPHGLHSASHTEKGGGAWALGRGRALRLDQPPDPPGLRRGLGVKDGTWWGQGV